MNSYQRFSSPAKSNVFLCFKVTEEINKRRRTIYTASSVSDWSHLWIMNYLWRSFLSKTILNPQVNSIGIRPTVLICCLILVNCDCFTCVINEAIEWVSGVHHISPRGEGRIHTYECVWIYCSSNEDIWLMTHPQCLLIFYNIFCNISSGLSTHQRTLAMLLVCHFAMCCVRC